MRAHHHMTTVHAATIFDEIFTLLRFHGIQISVKQKKPFKYERLYNF